MTSLDECGVALATRNWIQTMVIGLDLCPFARRVFQGNLIRYAISDAVDAESLRLDLSSELETLTASPETAIETTLLIHPYALTRFDDYCDFLPIAEKLLRSRGLRGVVQIASFHPDYQFEGTDPSAVENYTNRAPYPMLHLLRESSVTAAATMGADFIDEIPQRNIAKLRQLGLEKVLELVAGPGGSKHAV